MVIVRELKFMKKYFINTFVGQEKPSEMKGFIWNMLGSIMNALSTMVLSLFVIKIIGAKEGGVFSIALTLSQMLIYIAYFEMRTFQVTDALKKYSFGEYHSTKIILCVLTVLVGILYVFWKKYYPYKAIVVLLVCLWKLFDGYADVYESQFQTEGRLDLAGKSMAFRMLFSLLVFFSVLVYSRNLLVALIFMNFIAILGIIIFDVGVMNCIGKIELHFDWKQIKRIIFECFPLFIGTFCGVYILSASRIAIDSNMPSIYQSYYQVIFLPVSVINLFAGFVFKPLLTKLSLFYQLREMKRFYEIVVKGIVFLVFITLICVGGAFLLGIPILSFLSGCDLSVYRNNLVFLMIAGGFNAINYTLYYVLTIMRDMRSVLIDYIVAAFLAFFISSPLVKLFGMNGASLSFFIVVFTLCIMLTVSILKNNKKKID